MGAVRGAVRGARPPSHVAYYVAMGGVMLLLLLLCCYFFYFCVTKIKELSELDSLSGIPPAPRAPAAASYPIQPGVRDSASALAKLCKQLPAPPAGCKGGTVFPTSDDAHELPGGRLSDKSPLPVAPPIGDNQTPAAR